MQLLILQMHSTSYKTQQRVWWKILHLPGGLEFQQRWRNSTHPRSKQRIWSSLYESSLKISPSTPTNESTHLGSSSRTSLAHNLYNQRLVLEELRIPAFVSSSKNHKPPQSRSTSLFLHSFWFWILKFPNEMDCCCTNTPLLATCWLCHQHHTLQLNLD